MGFGFKLDSLILNPWFMISIIVIGLALALVAIKSGLISVEIYSSLVVMVLVTTVVFPFVMEGIIRKNPGIMS